MPHNIYVGEANGTHRNYAQCKELIFRNKVFESVTDDKIDMTAASSIGDGGSGPCCAKNPTQKNVPKTPPRKKPV